MKLTKISALFALFVLALSAGNLNLTEIPGLEVGTAEAGPLTKRLESKHKPSPHSQTASPEGDSEAREKCIEMLHKGDHEGAQNCIAELQESDSAETQQADDQVQPASQTAAAPSPSASSSAAAGAQGELYDARNKCAEMLRSGNRAGARECIKKLRN